jgi:hypothetical protein
VGVILGAFSGALIGGFAWLFDGPRNGALRCGGFMATLMGLLLFVGLVWAQGWAGIGNALLVALGAAVIGGFGGALFGAFLGSVAGPIFRDMVKEADEKIGA